MSPIVAGWRIIPEPSFYSFAGRVLSEPDVGHGPPGERSLAAAPPAIRKDAGSSGSPSTSFAGPAPKAAGQDQVAAGPLQPADRRAVAGKPAVSPAGSDPEPGASPAKEPAVKDCLHLNELPLIVHGGLILYVCLGCGRRMLR